MATASGTALGLSPTLLFGVLLVRGSIRIHLHRFFAVTSVVLIVLVLKLLAGGLHEFFEAGLLSSVLMLEAAVEVITSTTATRIILALLVLAPLACLAWDWRQAPVPEIPTQPNGVHPQGTAGRGRFTWWNNLLDHDGLRPGPRGRRASAAEFVLDAKKLPADSKISSRHQVCSAFRGCSNAPGRS